MPKAAFRDILATLRHTLPELLFRDPEGAAKTVRWATDHAPSVSACTQVLGTLEGWPQAAFAGRPALAVAYAHLACRARDRRALEAFLALLGEPSVPEVQVYRAWLLHFEGSNAAARVLLEPLTLLPGYEAGLRARLLGQCLAGLGEAPAAWRPHFAEARRQLQGLALGLSLLSEAAALYPVDRAAARRLWSEAWPRVQGDAYYSAWWRYHLGITALAAGDLESAGAHLAELERLCSKPDAAEFRTCGHGALGALRLQQGERERALAAYTRAVQAGEAGLGDPEDLEFARWGRGHTLRVLGRPEEAWGDLEAAQAVRGNPALQADRALCALVLGDLEAARAHLEAHTPTPAEPQNRHHLACAELARRTGDEAALRGALTRLDFAHYTLPEDVDSFPELFAWAHRHGFPRVRSAFRAAVRVKVRAEGPLRVWVGGHPVALGSTSKSGELLVFLLEQGGSAPLRRITEALFEGSETDHARHRKALHPHVCTLRERLGWPGSVQITGSCYTLDPGVRWDYDIHTLRHRGQRPRDFLAGIGSHWVQETAQALNTLYDHPLI